MIVPNGYMMRTKEAQKKRDMAELKRIIKKYPEEAEKIIQKKKGSKEK